jgi:adenine-specific DNA-methyltransferase
MAAQTIWSYKEAGHNQDAKKEIKEIFPEEVPFDTPKPTALLDRIMHLATDANSLVLDSFAGSGTTAHAVLAANAKDGGNRRFILVEGENYADTLTAERVRRVINGYAFKGTQREELLREPITFTKLKNANALLEKVQQIETLDGPKFDRISKTVKDGVLIVTGERDCTETAPGLGGTFTFCTLGDPIDMDGLLTGTDLPSLDQLAALLYHTATAQAFEPGQLVHAPDIGEHVYRLGTANGRHLWLFYKPDLDWLKSAEAALTLSNARAIAATEQEGVHLVFAPAKFVSRDLLAAQRIPVEYAPLPYALYRVETA